MAYDRGYGNLSIIMQLGTHLIIDLEKCNARFDYVHVVEDFIMKLNSEVLKMNVLSGPHTNYLVNNDDPIKNGVTSIMGIDTSHIAIHTFTKFDELKFDAYSCKNFHDDVPEVVNKLFWWESEEFVPFAEVTTPNR